LEPENRAQIELFQKTLIEVAALERCFVVLTVRSDFYSDLIESQLWPKVASNRIEIRGLGPERLREAIVKPAEASGVFLDPALVERLAGEAANEPGQLPLVQETLRLLWTSLRWRYLPLHAYEDLVNAARKSDNTGIAEKSGLNVAMAMHADEVFNSLSDTQRAIARRIFLRLIGFVEGRAYTRRQQHRSALQADGDDPAVFNETVELLVENRLLTVDSDHGIR
jgi:hypothetical protein